MNIFCKCDPVETLKAFKKLKTDFELQTQALYDKLKQLEIHCSETRAMLTKAQEPQPLVVEIEPPAESKK